MKKCSVCGEVYKDDSVEQCDICGSTDFEMASLKRNKPQQKPVNAGNQMNKPKPTGRNVAQRRPAKIQTEDEIDFNEGFVNTTESFTGADIQQDDEDLDMDFGSDFDAGFGDDDFDTDDFGDNFEEPEVPAPRPRKNAEPKPRPLRSPVAQQVANGNVQPKNPNKQRAQGQQRPGNPGQRQGQRPAGTNQQRVQRQQGQRNQQMLTPANEAEMLKNGTKPVKQKDIHKNPDGSSISDWLITFLFLIIPIWNIIFMILKLKKPDTPEFKKNFIKALLIYSVAMCALSTAIALTLGDKIVSML